MSTYNRGVKMARAEQERTRAALRAATAILRGSDTSRGGSNLRKSVARLRQHFDLDAPDVDPPTGDATRTAAARDRSRSTPALDPEPVQDYPFGEGPPWVPPAWRIQAREEAKMLQGVQEVVDSKPPKWGTEDELSDAPVDPHREIAARMREAKRKQNSQPMPGSGRR